MTIDCFILRKCANSIKVRLLKNKKRQYSKNCAADLLRVLSAGARLQKLMRQVEPCSVQRTSHTCVQFKVLMTTGGQIVH